MSPTTMPQMMEALVLKAYGGPEHTVSKKYQSPRPAHGNFSLRFVQQA